MEITIVVKVIYDPHISAQKWVTKFVGTQKNYDKIKIWEYIKEKKTLNH